MAPFQAHIVTLNLRSKPSLLGPLGMSKSGQFKFGMPDNLLYFRSHAADTRINPASNLRSWGHVYLAKV